MFRPARKSIQVVQKSLCIIGNLKEPLFQISLLYRLMTSPAFPIYHLFICCNCLAGWTPVHLSPSSVCQTSLIEEQEKPLCPFIVGRVARCQFSIPVIGYPEALQLFSHILYIAPGPPRRMYASLYSCILSWKTKRIPAHWM